MIDIKDREYDSDDEVKLQMKTYDDRLSFINKIDAKAYTKSQSTKPQSIKDSGLPIVLHEREIME